MRNGKSNQLITISVAQSDFALAYDVTVAVLFSFLVVDERAP